MRTLALAAVFGLASALKLKQATAADLTTECDNGVQAACDTLAACEAGDAAVCPWEVDDNANDNTGNDAGEEINPGIEDIMYLTFTLYDQDRNGSISPEEFTKTVNELTQALEANGYYNCSLDSLVDNADYIYESLGTDGYWEVVYNEDWGYDEWFWIADDEVTFDEFEEAYMEVAGWYGLTEYDLGFALLGMADSNGDWMVTETEIQNAIVDWNAPLSPEEVTAWFDEVWPEDQVYVDDAGNEERYVYFWDFEAWYMDEEFYAARDQPAVKDFVQIAVDTLANNDGTLDYWTVVQKLEDILDMLAEDNKITRSYYPDSMIESYVKYLMKYIAGQEYPEVSTEQATYALTKGNWQIDAYQLAYSLETFFDLECPDELGEYCDWGEEVYKRQEVHDGVQRYGMAVPPAKVDEIFDGLDTNDSGDVSYDETFEWAYEKWEPTDLEKYRYGY